MEIKIDIKLSREQALHTQLGAQAPVHEFPGSLGFPQLDIITTFALHGMRAKLSLHRNHESLTAFIQPELDLLNGPHPNPEEDDWRPDLQPLCGTIEVHNHLAPFLEQISAGQ